MHEISFAEHQSGIASTNTADTNSILIVGSPNFSASAPNAHHQARASSHVACMMLLGGLKRGSQEAE
jgi:hypothetical protein